MFDIIVTGLAAAVAVTAAPQGDRLKPLDQCFTIYRRGAEGDVPIGTTRQVIRAVRVEGKPAWDIVVHQRVPMAKFAMRDHFVLNRADLLPIAFDNRRSGVEHVTLRYAPGRITGTRTEAGAPVAIDVAASAPVWEGNLWGVTFGALPLAADKRFTLPFYQYDSGLGSFTLSVTASQSVDTPTGAVQAWVVAIEKNGKPSATALIAQDDGRELGSYGARGGTRLGGDCSGLD